MNYEQIRELEKHYKELVKPVSETLASYLHLEDWAEDDDLDLIKIHIGNLPMPCPNCGRMRLNFRVDLHRIDCEKCDWYSGESVPDDTFHERKRWSGWQVGEVRVDAWEDPKTKTIRCVVNDGKNMLTHEGENFGAEQGLAILLANAMRRIRELEEDQR